MSRRQPAKYSANKPPVEYSGFEPGHASSAYGFNSIGVVQTALNSASTSTPLTTTQISIIEATAPSDLCCPITQELMKNPVLCREDGRTYEKTAIDQWLARGETKSPMNRAEISKKSFAPDLSKKALIEKWRVSQGLQSFSLKECQDDIIKSYNQSSIGLAIPHIMDMLSKQFPSLEQEAKDKFIDSIQNIFSKKIQIATDKTLKRVTAEEKTALAQGIMALRQAKSLESWITSIQEVAVYQNASVSQKAEMDNQATAELNEMDQSNPVLKHFKKISANPHSCLINMKLVYSDPEYQKVAEQFYCSKNGAISAEISKRFQNSLGMFCKLRIAWELLKVAISS